MLWQKHAENFLKQKESSITDPLLVLSPSSPFCHISHQKTPLPILHVSPPEISELGPDRCYNAARAQNNAVLREEAHPRMAAEFQGFWCDNMALPLDECLNLRRRANRNGKLDEARAADVKPIQKERIQVHVSDSSNKLTWIVLRM